MTRALAAVLLAAALAGCSGKVVSYQVQIVTASCDATVNPFEGVAYLQVRVKGDGLDAPLEATTGADTKALTVPEIPAGKNRVVEVRAYGTAGPGSKVLAYGATLPFEVPDVMPEIPTATTLAVFLRKVDAFTPTATAATPRDCARMKVPRAGHTATLLKNGKVYLAGGYRFADGTATVREALADAELYNPNTGAFESARSLSVGSATLPRAFHTATRLRSGQVLIWGGEGYLVPPGNNGPIPQSGIIIYDPDVDLYGAVPSRKAPQPANIARSHHQAVEDANGKVLLVGGMGLNPQNQLVPVDRIEWFDPATNAANVLDQPTMVRLETAAAAVQDGGIVAVAGGSDGTALRRDVTYFQYDGTTFKVTGTSPQLAQGRRAAAAVAVRQGNDLMVLGGYNDVSAVAPLSSSEVVATRTNGVGDGPALGGARGDICATVLHSGTVFAVGGRTVDGAGQSPRSDGASLLASALPAGGYTSLSGPTLNPARWAHTCTTLADGTVLITGGLREGGAAPQVLQDAWIYQPTPAD